jgi:hypothetical protein
MKCILISLMLIGISFAQPQVQHFLPDVFTQFPGVRDLAISSTQDEAYFTAQSYLGEISVILDIRKENGMWSQSKIASFSGKYQDLEPFLSPDGLRLYFASNRPLNTSETKTKDFDIWYVERESQATEWSEPVNIGSPVNSESDEFYPSISDNGNLYFTSNAAGSKGKDDIFFSKWENGRYSTPVSLSDSVNSEGYEFNAFISPDESFIIFSGYNREDGLGSGDLYISFKNADGTWSKAKNLGSEINSDKMDYCPFVDLNSRILYFTSKRSRLDYGTSGFAAVSDLLTEIDKYENGLSRIYQVSVQQMLSEHRQ